MALVLQRTLLDYSPASERAVVDADERIELAARNLFRAVDATDLLLQPVDWHV